VGLSGDLLVIVVVGLIVCGWFCGVVMF